MKQLTRRIFLLLILVVLSACSHNLPYNQFGETDRDKIAFKYRYQKESYPKYTGKISVKTDKEVTYVKFDSIRVYLYSSALNFKSIFSSGLFTAQMIYCKTDSLCRPTPTPKWAEALLKNDIQEKQSVWTGHTIQIEHFEELTHLNHKPTVRRFKFWSHPYRIRLNGGNDIFLLELTNENADEKTDFNTFLNGARVTFLLKDRMMI